ncbi:hypothetical protein, partial [Achromobacter denitrificans]|uniref:hypothetical protein n=1 Tax=Achromobacter denitrificans TaxID=32002 RepID=UPI003B9D2863
VSLINPLQRLANFLFDRSRFTVCFQQVFVFRCRFCLVPLAKKRDYARTKWGVQVALPQKAKLL